MNLLSLITLFAAFAFILMAYRIHQLNPREPLNRLSALVDVCFAIWALSFAFMYSAATAEQAFFWNKIGSIGYIMFGVVALQFFVTLAGENKSMNRPVTLIIIYALPTILLVRNFVDTVAVAGMTPSRIGWGWTYLSNYQSVWFWLYVIYLASYFGIAFIIAARWASKSKRTKLNRQVRFLILSVGIMMILGAATDLVLPVFTPFLPPLCILLLLVWGYSSRYVIRIFKFVSLIDAATPELILRTVTNPILMTDSNGIIKSCNQACIDLLKYNSEQIIDRPLSDFFQSGIYDQSRISKLMSEKKLRNIEIEMVDANGQVIQTLMTLSVAENNTDGIVGIVVSIHDVSQMKQAEIALKQNNEKYRKLSEHLVRIANFDELTKLPNRRMFFDKLDYTLAEFNRTQNGFALVFIDLDGFKSVNDSFGHAIGDQILKVVADILLAAVRKNDLVARIGGDEFILLITECSQISMLDNLLQRILEKFAKPLIIDGRVCPIGISIGISLCPDDSETADELLRLADERMYLEKSGKRSRL